jgi:hypothetical protein
MVLNLPPQPCPKGPCGLFILVVLGFAFAAGVWLLAWSLILLLEKSHPRIWGILVTASYAVLFLPLFGISQIALETPQVGTLVQLLSWLGIVGPILGLIGGVWGILLKRSRENVPGVRPNV